MTTSTAVQQELGLLDMTLNMRHELLNVLTDDDLTYQITGNPTLGQLLKQFVETEQQYAESFVTGRHNWALTLDDNLATSVDALKAGFAKTEENFKANFGALGDDELHSKIIDRQHMQLPARVQYHVYREAFLIYHGKVAIYLNAMGKALPPQLAQWVG